MKAKIEGNPAPVSKPVSRRNKPGSGSIIERVGKSGLVTYIIKYSSNERDKHGNPKRNYFTIKGGTRDAAEIKQKELVLAVLNKTHVARTGLTVGDWLETWLSDYAADNVSTKTLERYAELLRLHVIRYLGSKTLQDLTPLDIQSLYAKLRKSGRRLKPSEASPVPAPAGLSALTVRHVHRSFSQAIKAAKKTRQIASNPFDDVEGPTVKRSKISVGEARPGKAKIRALDNAGLDRLLIGLSANPPKSGLPGRPHCWRELFPIVAVAAGTGMRRGEIVALAWQDVDFEARTITVWNSVSVTKKEGVTIEGTKTEKSQRPIGIDPGLVELLRSHRVALAEDALKFGLRLDGSCLVFPVSPADLQTPRNPDKLTKAFSRAARVLGFKELRFHDLRHTHATLQLTAGTPLNAVSERLGHSSPVITLSVYGHVIPRAEERAVEVSGTLLAGALASYRQGVK
jgi:integrase